MNKLALVLVMAVPSLALAQQDPSQPVPSEPAPSEPVTSQPETSPPPTTTPKTSKNLTGRFGVGGQLGNVGGVPGAISLKYWISDLGIQALLGFDHTGDPDDAGPAEDQTALGLGVRLLYNFARANDTNMYAGGGVSLGVIDADQVNIDFVLGIEHFFTDYFSVAGHVGLGIGVAGDTKSSIELGNTAFWGSSFHFYF